MLIFFFIWCLYLWFSCRIKGVKIVLEFVSEAEEKVLLQQLDEVPWDGSQSGRLKQVLECSKRYWSVANGTGV